MVQRPIILSMTNAKTEVSDQELKVVISDFLEMGHVDNIIALFRSEPQYYEWTGELLKDERFNVRLGLSVLFEELKILQPEKLSIAIPSLVDALGSEESLIRGEAVSLLGIIGTDIALDHIRNIRNDTSPQVREIVQIVMEDKL